MSKDLPLARMLLLYLATWSVGSILVGVVGGLSQSPTGDFVLLAIEFSAVYTAGRLAVRRMTKGPGLFDLVCVAVLAWVLRLTLPVVFMTGLSWLQGAPTSLANVVTVLWEPDPASLGLTWLVLIDLGLGMAFNLVGLALGVKRERHLRGLFRQWDREPVAED